ncbi:MAG: MarR family winged helix-turn-helix transcriptional regulator [Lachnospiraceae bacterium]
MVERKLGFLIKSINDKIKVKADADLKEHDITLSQSRVLGFLNNHENKTASQKEIEMFLEVTHATAAGIVSRMEKHGLVDCWLSPEDKRNKMVRLTKKAQAVSQDMEDTIQTMEMKMIGGLTKEEADELERMLMLVFRNIE